MATDLTITLNNQPGELARLGEALGNAGVNMEGLVGMTSAGTGTIHVLVEDAGAARSAIENAGMTIDEAREVVVTRCEDAPGAAGAIARKLADAGVNINLAYLATNTRLVIGADDLEKAKSAL